MPLIEARRLSKTFGLSPVLRRVELEVDGGSGGLIVGGNGSGKSTLLRLLAGLSSPSAGEALLFGNPARGLAPSNRRRVGLVTHQSFLYPNLTARENLQFYAALYGLRLGSRRLGEWLELTGLAAFADERVRTFSRGMEQRLAVVRAMLASPEVLLMDEPFAALDPEGAATISQLVEQAMERGCAVVITAHQPLAFNRGVDCHQLVGGRLRSGPRAGAAIGTREQASLAAG